MTLNLFAGQLIEAGANDAAIALLELNREYFPASSQIEASLGRAHETAGNLDAALDAYRRALGKDPGLSGFLQPRIDKLENAAPGQSQRSEPGRPIPRFAPGTRPALRQLETATAVLILSAWTSFATT